MSLSMYDASVPVLVHNLKALAGILKKAEQHAKQAGIDPQVLLNARLFPDMFALARQVQIASDTVKGGCARLAGVEVPSWADDEASFAELQARIAKTIAFAKSCTRTQFEGSEQRPVTLRTPRGDLGFSSGQSYLLGWVLPNFWFHMGAAYNILRHNGVPLGKMDFLAHPPGVTLPGFFQPKKKAAKKPARTSAKKAAKGK